MIKILKQRKFVDPDTGKIKRPMTALGVSAKSLKDLLINLEDYVEQIPPKDRFNIHYTLCNCKEEVKGRAFESQDIIPFDVDKIDISKIDLYPPIVISAIGLNKSDVAIIYSGRGIHLLVGTTKKIVSSEYFGETKKYYNLICERIDRALHQAELPGEADRGLWTSNHTLRLPGTKNIKNKETGYPNLDFSGECVLVTRVINEIEDLCIEDLARGEKIADDSVVKIESKFVSSMGTYYPDSRGVVEECNFIKWCREHQEDVKEPQWRAMLSIVTKLENGEKLSHEYSKKHPSYEFQETQDKIENIKVTTFPYRCTTIETLWDGCKDCKHYQKCTSPISIKSESFIGTKNTGFRNMVYSKDAVHPKPGPINFDDLIKYYSEIHPFFCTEAGITYIFNGTHWEVDPVNFIKGFAERNVRPSASSPQMTEFSSRISLINQRKSTWITSTTDTKMNLKNGVLDLSGREPVMLPHSSAYGFMNVLNYDYNPDADCPMFDQFMDDITDNREDLKKILLEFAGYAFSNAPCKYSKSLFLVGGGSNGKSTFLNVLKKLAGDGAYSAASLKNLNSEPHLMSLQGKLFNVSEENASGGLKDLSNFKSIVTGGTVMVKKLYSNPFEAVIKAKLMFAANELPESNDATSGFLRRLLIVPFDVQFSGENRDINMEEKLYAELPGILNRVIEGYQRLEKQQGFTHSETVMEELNEYREFVDPIRNYVKENLVCRKFDAEEEEGALFKSIYDNYKGWCVQNNQRALSSNQFSSKLAPVIKDFRKRRKIKGGNINRTIIYRGVFLLERNNNPGF